MNLSSNTVRAPLCIVPFFCVLWSGSAFAQSATIPTAALGNVASAATGQTIFTFAPSGSVTRLSGSGVRVSTGAVVFSVTVSCSAAQCDKLNSLVKIGAIGTPSGRAGPLSNFTVAMGTAKLISGPTGANPTSFVIGPIGKGRSATFAVGADFPVLGDDSGASSGLASTAIYLTVSKTDGSSATTSSGAATATVFRSLSLSNSAPLQFGRIVLPVTGSGTVALAASTGTLVVNGGVALASPPASRAAFTITGEGAQTVSVTVPPTIVMTNPAGATLTVSTSNTAQGTQQLSSSLGSAGSLTFYVGGAFSFSSTTPTGAYSGAFTVTAAYN